MEFYAAFRSNAFKVKDTFKDWIILFPELDIYRDGDKYSIRGLGTLPNDVPTENGYRDCNFLEELSKHIADNDVCIIYEVAFAENASDTAGYAIAIRGGKEPFNERFVALDIHTIEKMAKKRFALPVTA